MASAPKHPCGHIGCPALVPHGQRFCAAHQGDAKQYDRDRGNSAERGYDRRWRDYRVAWLAEHRLCGDRLPDAYTDGQEWSECRKAGKWIRARVVDHIRGARFLGLTHEQFKYHPLFYDPRNHQSLCDACNAAKTRAGR